MRPAIGAPDTRRRLQSSDMLDEAVIPGVCVLAWVIAGMIKPK